jgi:Rrf2 family iron-sulfur cluster assembly transcriptional regulator
MRLTTKGRFAVTAMIDSGAASGHRPGGAGGHQPAQQISLSYLEQLFGKLRRHELVESTRGPGGGYSLGRGAGEITVADIIVAVDEPIDATGCGGKENCMGEDAGKCMTHDLWASLNAKMIEYLDSISLKKLVDEQLAKGVSIDEAPVKRAISSVPVVKPIKVTAPNSVFALGNAFNEVRPVQRAFGARCSNLRSSHRHDPALSRSTWTTAPPRRWTRASSTP